MINKGNRSYLRLVESGEARCFADWARVIAAERGSSFDTVYKHLCEAVNSAYPNPAKAYGATWMRLDPPRLYYRDA